MLIIEKERDIEILKSLGADNNLIRKIFIFEGWLISIIGAIAGIITWVYYLLASADIWTCETSE